MAFSGGGVFAAAGEAAKVAIGIEETAWGTAAAAQMFPGLVDNLVIGVTEDVFVNRGITGLRTSSSQTQIAEKFKVQMSGKMINGVPLAAMLGYISATSTPTVATFRGPTHSAPTKSYLPSLTVFRTLQESSNQNRNILGCTVQRGTFGCQLDGPVTFMLDMIGKTQATTTAANPTITTDSLGYWNTELKVKENSATYVDGSAVVIDSWLGWSAEVNNNPDVRNSAFTGTSPLRIRQPIPGQATQTLSITRRLVDEDLWNYITDGRVHSFRAAITNSVVTLNIDFDSCIAQTSDQTMPLEKQVEQVAKFDVKNIHTAVTDACTYVSWA